MKSKIYLLECVNDLSETTYKIGYTSSDVNKRIKSLQTGNPGIISVLSIFETEYGQKVERALHRRYSHLRLKGEWFHLEPENLLSFQSDCKKIEENLKVLENANNPFLFDD